MNATRSWTFFSLAVITLTMLSGGCSSTPSTTSPAAANVNHPYDETANAQNDITAALGLAKTDKKFVLLDFGGNWCPDCIALAKSFETEPLKAFVEKNYHIVSIDVGKFDKNLDICALYGNPIQAGVPAVVVLDPAGIMVGTTGDGSFANARGMNPQEVLTILQKWAAFRN